jgi:RNA polymerase sigma factor (sigma-70 family)
MMEASQLYSQYHSKIYNLAWRMTGNIHDAADITQDTFIQAMNSLETFRAESSVYTWLYRIASNKCLRFLQKKKVKSRMDSMQQLIDTASSPMPADITDHEKRSYIDQVKEGCLSGLLRCLPVQQRMAFILHIFAGLSASEVAIILGKSVNASTVLIHRARQNIREFLCKNCSLYDSNNTCRCENLVKFSLNQGWIHSINPSQTQRAESEIKNLKDVVRIYKSLSEKTPDSETSLRIREWIEEKKNLSIFQPKKVKE